MRRSSSVLTLLLALVCAGLGAATAASWRSSADGVVALSLPWIGALYYGALAVLQQVRPASPVHAHAMGFTVFVHACLVSESLLDGRWCWPCLGVAALAFVTASLRGRAEAGTLASGLLFGAVAGAFAPLERVDGALTRRVWPSRILDFAPAWADRGELAAPCAHGAPVKLTIVERDCRG
jgi:hypothetical protein